VQLNEHNVGYGLDDSSPDPEKRPPLWMIQERANSPLLKPSRIVSSADVGGQPVGVGRVVGGPSSTTRIRFPTQQLVNVTSVLYDNPWHNGLVHDN
jgi:hypothetical protein